MATSVSSTKTHQRSARHVSKSPKRRYSPSRVQPDVLFESEESAYSDPIDSCRSLISNVVFERRDRESLSSQATQLFNSQTTFEDEAERLWLLENIHSTTILIKVDQVVFTINGNYALKEYQPCVLFLHGFGVTRNWANWIKLAYPLSQRKRYSVIFVDLPGFGQSSGRSLDQTSWKRYGPEILIAILSSFHLRHSVSVVAQCGGAATTVRAINRYPQWFRGRGLVFSNSVIGDFGESKEFEANLTKYNIHIVVYWIPDQDHTKYCVAYKRWNKLRLASFRNLQLVDLDPAKQTMKQFYPVIHVVGISRCSSKNEAYVYKLSDEFIQQVIDTLDRKS
ncbi:unnamed protein product [Rotaria sp. Silwood2]|nr:unnamed protein product [Rotaria sp. Silwood2]CAF2533187.1 unnamed protein product [Rotaria sp. Silwood2]CAF2785541.1 unnamed protein product [Rotaria sp. Silwood2]CAF2930360.1 unnamed protein product [Rotaria sp. Silwood2]CAF3856741.1 unnamed protein product [Rotaria sp. Silwood2]